ncbi:hypothetical protein AVEN_203826-1 [Araneus ventricosus]|uniref:Spidroin N-terminal domain-containing protein n=1 Tax=Araneus ventricosus TaxID=182803 RepID=A0A4Y2HWF9_ARAVE|nr:hypothetical protein AVEN_203826-1 [Araneus ventricosus]
MQNGNRPGQSYPQQNDNRQDSENEPGQSYPQQNGNRQGPEEDPDDPLGFNELGDQFAKTFVQNVVNNPKFGKGADTDFTEVTFALSDAMNLLRQAHHAPPEQKRTIMIAFSATIAELIVIECRDSLTIFEKVHIVTDALKTAYRQTTGRTNRPLINEVTFLVIIFLDETSQKPPVNIHKMFPGFPGLMFLPRTFQPKFTYDPRLISYIFGHPEDFTSNIPTKHGIPQEQVPGQNYTIYFPFLLRFIEEVENLYPLYPYHTMPKSEYELLFPQLYQQKPHHHNYTIFRPGTNPYVVIHKHPGHKKTRKVRHKHYRKVRNPHYRPGEPSYVYSIYYTTSSEGTPTTPSGLTTTPGGTTEFPLTSYFGTTTKITVPERGTTPGEGQKTTIPGVGTTPGEGEKTTPGIGTTPGKGQTSPGIGTTPVKGQTTPGIGTTPGEGEKTTVPGSGTTSAFGTRTPRSGERVHLHKHKRRIKNPHYRPGEPLYVYSYYYTTSKEGTTTTASGLITTPGGTTEFPLTSYFGPTPKITVPEKGTTPGEGQKTTIPVVGTTPGEGEKTTPGIGTTPAKGQTPPVFGTTPGKGQTSPGIGSTPGKDQTTPGIGTTPGEGEKTTVPESGTTSAFGTRTPRSGERVHLHKHKRRIKNPHYRPGEPLYV